MIREHPQRTLLNDEVHARPPASVAAPADVSYFALMHGGLTHEEEFELLVDLLAQYGVERPEAGRNHYLIQMPAGRDTYVDGIRVKWERHSEFTSYTFIGEGNGGEDFDATVLSVLSADWLESLRGDRIAAAHVAVRDFAVGEGEVNDLARRWLAGNTPIGAYIAEGSGAAFTDFRIQDDGYSRLLIARQDMNPRQCGRMLQRLLELDTYRMLALLALPVAKSLVPFLDDCEQTLAGITRDMTGPEERDDRALLERLIALEADVQGRDFESHYRFSAASAYYDLVTQRTTELRQARIKGIQNFAEFTERRLAPAMRTCRAVAARQESLADRTARVTQLLSTRVSVTLEQQSQALLQSMNSRTKQQLRLQETVEGLSIAAVTYYTVGLLNYASKGLSEFGVVTKPAVITSLSVPLVLVLVAWGLRRVKRSVEAVA